VGRACHDPQADAAFFARLAERLERRQAIKPVDMNLYSPEFARVAVDEFVRLYREGAA
jgi:uncharacterized protein (UPF0261 family)